MNTTIATMAAMLAWLLVERIVHGKATSLGAASGVVAGLVAITPACGALSPVGSIILGAVAGAVCALAVGLKYKLGYDDSLDVVGVHFVGGWIGSLFIGLFATTDVNGAITDVLGASEGLFYGGGIRQLVVQVLVALFAVLWSAVATLVVGLVVKAILGLRVTEEDEVEGIDFADHGESAYDMSGTTGSTSRRPSVLTESTATKEGANA
jgi:Amt family ammonium transporter